jgi:hypothetical protein
MKTSNDFIRQASRYTMNGLIDPRLLPGYKPSTEVGFNVLAGFQKMIERIFRKVSKGTVHA